MLSFEDLEALGLTLKLAALVTVLLLLLGTPLAYWLSRTDSRIKPLIESLVALPLILPPSVLGFYLLLLLGPDGPIGKATAWLGFDPLPFSFRGLVVTSVIYSLPFVVQPLNASFQSISPRLMDAAATLGASPPERFFRVALPLARPGFLMAAILGFAHTLGEFGVVLMIGGNIPGETRVISVQIFDYVEALDYPRAHQLSSLLLVFSFMVLAVLYRFNPARSRALGA